MHRQAVLRLRWTLEVTVGAQLSVRRSVSFKISPISANDQRRLPPASPPRFLARHAAKHTGTLTFAAKRNQPAFALPSLQTIPEFVARVEVFHSAITSTHSRLSRFDRQRLAVAIERGETMNLFVIAKTLKGCLTEYYVKQEMIHTKVWDPDKLRPGMVPFQTGVSLIDKALRSEEGRELSRTDIDRFLKDHVCYKEIDVFVAVPAIREGSARTPVVCIMGHIDHGKTTLLDGLQNSAIAATEAGKITQNIRAFTITAKEERPSNQIAKNSTYFVNDVLSVGDPYAKMTFVDTPGHKIFAELRLRGQTTSDIVVLLVALDEGVQGQTLEVVQMALQLKRPIVVALNKVDLYTDPEALGARIAFVAKQLAEAGLTVTLVDDDALLRLHAPPDDSSVTRQSRVKKNRRIFIKEKGTEVHVADSQLASRPRIFDYADIGPVSLETAASTTIVSAPEKNEAPSVRHADPAASVTNEPEAPALRPELPLPKAYEVSEASVVRQASRKALAVAISGLQGTNVPLLVKAVRAIAKVRNPCADSGVKAPKQAVILESFKRGKNDGVASDTSLEDTRVLTGAGSRPGSSTSSQVVVLCCVVRSGIIEPGLPFVADSAWGVITHLEDMWGRRMKRALPGEAVNILGTKSVGAPAAGTHVICLETQERAESVASMRKLLHRYVEALQGKQLDILRPPDRRSAFLHIGNYGQVKQDPSVEFALLHKTAKASEHSNALIEHAWLANQLPVDEHPKTDADMQELAHKVRCLWVALRVDTYHSARLLTREVPRLGTKDVVFQVVGVSFAAMTHDELQQNPRLNVVLSFRAPLMKCAKTAFSLSQRRVQHKEFDVYTDLIDWMKEFALKQQREVESDREMLGGRSSINAKDIAASRSPQAAQLRALAAAGVEDVVGATRPQAKLTSTPEEAARPRPQAMPKMPI